MKVSVQIHRYFVSIDVQPSHTVGSLLSQFLRIQNLEQQPDGQQRLLLGDALLDSDSTLADIGIEDGAKLVFADLSQQLSAAVPRAAASASVSRHGAKDAAPASQSLAPMRSPVMKITI